MSNEDTYSIKEMIGEFRRDVSAEFKEVKDKQDHTNGDVTNLKMWRAYLTGGLAVISGIVIPLLVYVWNQNMDAQSRLQSLQNNSQIYK